MSVEQAIVVRMNDLVDQSRNLQRTNEHSQATSEQHVGECVGWIAAVLNVVQQACGSEENACWKKANTIEHASRSYGYAIPRAIPELAQLLLHLRRDMEAGLLGSIADRARAETFDNFLDHGRAYLEDGRIKEAGVIAGVVFEDAVRRVCRKHHIEEKDIKLDNLISALVKIGVLTEVKAKRACAAAGVRTKATHAQWDEFTTGDVSAAIAVTDEIVSTQLDG